jgi:hypothetical protein
LFERHAPPDIRAESAGKPIEEVRAIRDAVELRVEELLEERIDAIRSDRTAHQLRLARLLPDLVKEFRGLRSDDEIRACADAIWRTTGTSPCPRS